MKHLFMIAVLAAGAVCLSAFGLNYTASKSNTGNIVVHSPAVSEAQAAAILAEIDKSKQAPSEAAVRGYLKKTGVKQGAIKTIVVETTGGKTTVLLLDDPADLTKAKDVVNTATSRSNQQHNN